MHFFYTCIIVDVVRQLVSRWSRLSHTDTDLEITQIGKLYAEIESWYITRLANACTLKY